MANDGKRRVDLQGLRLGVFGGGVGVVLVAVGLLAIGLGWNGAAGAGGQINGVTNLSAQLPWLLSGGFLGLALVVFGAAMVVVHNARVDRARLEAKLEQLIEVTQAGAPVAPTSAAGLFVAGASSYHRPDCRLVGGRSDVGYVTGAEAHAQDLTPCRVCKPESVETLAG